MMVYLEIQMLEFEGRAASQDHFQREGLRTFEYLSRFHRVDFGDVR